MTEGDLFPQGAELARAIELIRAKDAETLRVYARENVLDLREPLREGKEKTYPLTEAVRTGDAETIAAVVSLVEREPGRAAFAAIETDDPETITTLTAHGVHFDRQSAQIQGISAAQFSAMRSSAETIRTLARIGVDYNDRDPSGSSPSEPPVVAAARRVDEPGGFEALRAVVDAGARVDAQARVGDVPDTSALQIVTRRGHVEAVGFLLSRGADPDLRDARGRTAYQIGVEREALACLDLIAAGGASVETLSRAQGERDPRLGAITPLASAFLSGNAELVDRVLAHGARIEHDDHATAFALAERGSAEVLGAFLRRRGSLEVVGRHGERPAHRAALASNHAAIYALAKARVPLDARDDAGDTPLHVAARHGSRDTILAFMHVGADRTIRDAHGATPEDVAHRTRSPEVRSAFREIETVERAAEIARTKTRPRLRIVYDADRASARSPELG